METTYPVSQDEQLALFQECFDEAKAIGQEYGYTLAMAQSMFQYRIGIMSNDKGLDAKLEKEL